jgi:hypothetical protein
MARMIGATRSGLLWIVGCVCALFFGRDLAAQTAQREYGVRPQELKKPAITDEQRAAAEKLVAEYLAAAEAERQPVVDELKKMGVAGQSIVWEKVNAARQAAAAAKEAATKAEAEDKTEEAAKLRAEAEQAQKKSATLVSLFAALTASAPGQPVSKYGARPR